MKVAVLQSIENNGPLISSQIRCDTMLSWKVVQDELEVLQKQGLVTTLTGASRRQDTPFRNQEDWRPKTAADLVSLGVKTSKSPAKSQGREKYILTEKGKSVLEAYTKLQQEFRNLERLEEPMPEENVKEPLSLVQPKIVAK
jgi:predicted transcriptional regulator